MNGNDQQNHDRSFPVFCRPRLFGCICCWFNCCLFVLDRSFGLHLCLPLSLRSSSSSSRAPERCRNIGARASRPKSLAKGHSLWSFVASPCHLLQLCLRSKGHIQALGCNHAAVCFLTEVAQHYRHLSPELCERVILLIGAWQCGKVDAVWYCAMEHQALSLLSAKFPGSSGHGQQRQEDLARGMRAVTGEGASKEMKTMKELANSLKWRQYQPHVQRLQVLLWQALRRDGTHEPKAQSKCT